MRLRPYLFLYLLIFIFFYSFFVSKISAASSSSSMVGYWKIDESTQGSNAIDSSGYNNMGSAHGTGGGPNPSTDVPTTVFPDPYSASFNNANQYFEIPDASNLDSTNAITLSVWIKLTATDGNYHTIAGKWYVGVHQQYLIQINNNKKIGFWTGDGNTCADNLESTGTISAGSWIHVLGIQNGVTKTLYINGIQNNTKTSVCSLGTSSASFTIGSKWNSLAQYFEFFNGNIDDVRLYSRALSSTEAADLAAGRHTSATWTGNVSSAFETGGNWDINVMPDPYTHLIFPSTTNHAALSANESAASASINANAILDLGGFTLSYNDGGSLTNNGTLWVNGQPTPIPSSSSSVSPSHSQSSNTPATCSGFIPVGIPDLFQINTTKNNATLYFTPVSGASNYLISYGFGDSADQFNVFTNFGSSDGVISFSVGDLPSNTSIYFHIRAQNDCMPGNWGNTLMGKTTKSGNAVFYEYTSGIK
jgi:hypothetical protein